MRFWWWVLEVKGFLGIGIIGIGIGNWIGLKSQTSFLGFALGLTLCIYLSVHFLGFLPLLVQISVIIQYSGSTTTCVPDHSTRTKNHTLL